MLTEKGIATSYTLGSEQKMLTVAEPRLYRREKGMVIVHTPGGEQEMLTVTEPGLYRLFSKNKEAPNWMLRAY